MRLLSSFCIILLLLQGCTTPVRDTTDQATKEQEEQAEAYLDSGNYIAAAEEYLALSDKNKSESVNYLLKAANAYLKGDQIVSTQSILDSIQDDKIDPVQKAEKNILLAGIALANNDALLAINRLGFDLPDATPAEVRAGYYSNLATALQIDQQYINALHARIHLEQYIDDPLVVENNHQKIWKLLSLIPVPDLEQLLMTITADDNLAGWTELAIISKMNLYDMEKLETSVTSWSQRYPSHPARGKITEEIFTLAQEAVAPPGQIALLLPFNSQYRDISNAIREGFLSAWYETPGEKPVIRIYNYSNQNIVDVYNKAVNDGAGFIVGPLEKEAILALLDTGDITVKTLALNRINTNESAGNTTTAQDLLSLSFFQFGLLPEDEARQAAERAWTDGYANALVITPDTTWGERIYTAFTTRWNELGGIIVEHVRIPAGTQDFSLPVKQLLNIDKSEQRAKELIATLNRKIFYEPRYRRDADTIFLASTPLMARQIVPQFRYYQANDLIIYSISNIYSGIYDPQTNSDINAVVFPDMPWLLDPDYEYSILQQTLNKTWDQNLSPYRRFYAFGIDAYRLIPELGRLFSQNSSFAGATGTLKVNRQGIIQRTSGWAKFVEGAPQLLQTH